MPLIFARTAPAKGKLIQITYTPDEEVASITVPGSNQTIISAGGGGSGGSGNGGSTISLKDDNRSLRITGSNYDDLILGGLAENDINSGSGNDIVVGTFGSNGKTTITGGDGNDLIFANGLEGGWWKNALYSSNYQGIKAWWNALSHEQRLAFANTAGSSNSTSSVNAGADQDTVVGAAGDDTLDGGDGSDVIYGGGGSDVLVGGWGADSLYGGAGNDCLSGDNNSDKLFGGSGTDTLDGGYDDDYLSNGNFENDPSVYTTASGGIYDGGKNNDTIVVRGLFTGVLQGSSGNDLLDGRDASGNLTLYGGNQNDTIYGGSGNDTADGNSGDDKLYLGKGNDTASWTQYYAGSDPDLDKGPQTDVYDGGADFDMLRVDLSSNWIVNNRTALQGLVASFIRGGSVSGSIVDKDGKATLNFTNFEDLVVYRDGVLFWQNSGGGLGGGPWIQPYPTDGNDTVYEWLVGAAQDPARFKSLLGGDDTFFAAPAKMRLPNWGWPVGGGDGNDSMYGDSDDDIFTGDAGNDLLLGGMGNDTLDGGAGANTVSGGTGNDLVLSGYDPKSPFGSTLNGDEGNDTIIGGEGNDTASGGSGDDSISGRNARGGSDSIDAGDGSDIVDYGGSWGANTIRGGEGQDLLGGGSGNDSLSGDNGNDTLFGNAGNDVLDGSFGNDSLDGGDGNDFLMGSWGDDSLNGGRGDDTFVFNRDQKWSALTGPDNPYVRFSGNGGQDYYVQMNGQDKNGRSSNIAFSYDSFDGGEGNDSLVGTTANDSFIAVMNGKLYYKNIEVFDGGAGNDVIDLYGYGQGARVRGGAGDDVLVGSSFGDTLVGGGGDDTLAGGAGDDRFVFTLDAPNGNDVVVDFAMNDKLVFATAQNLTKNQLLGMARQDGTDALFSFGSSIGSLRIVGVDLAVLNSNRDLFAITPLDQ